MKKALQRIAPLFLLSCAVVWGVLADQSTPALPLSSLLPEGALLYLEAKDFHSLLSDWNTSEEKRSWLASDNHAAFSRSRLFSRLGQAQDEFATAAGIPTDAELLEKVAGKESCLGLYDIGQLEFVYVTRLQQKDIENTPLWQTRGKFEQRSEAGIPFYLRQDIESHRVAAFAVRDDWLILGTRQDLVAGVLDHLAHSEPPSLANEAWFTNAMHAAPTAAGDLRMVLNLDRIVPSPYFRSYWVQRNITEMKQYTAAVSDLYRAPQSYRDQRIMLRRPGASPAAMGSVDRIAALAPEDAGFWSAQASPTPEAVLKILRSNFLELKTQQIANDYYAPPAPAASDSGSASDLEVRIDQAQPAEYQADPYASLQSMLGAMQPDAILQVYSTGQPHNGMFLSMRSAMVLSAAHPWNEQQVKDALTAAILPGLTAAKLGADWQTEQGASGPYLALRGPLALYAAIRSEDLMISTDAPLLESLLRQSALAATPHNNGLSYVADFHHTREQENFHALTLSLDRAGHRSASDENAPGQSPAFFSGNLASLSRVFARMTEERVEEKDQDAIVTQTVTYQWKQ